MTGPDDPRRAANRERFRAAAADERPDLALLCLLIGAEAATPEHGGARPDGPEHGGAAVDEAQIELDRLAGLLPARLRGRGGAGSPGGAAGAATGAADPRAWAEALRELLGAREGFHGTPGDYRRLDSSLLQAVLHRRRGLPILLSVVWTEVARRAGAPVYGVGLPGHFVVGFGDPLGDHVLADPYAGGALLGDQDVAEIVARATGSPAPVTPGMLRPAGPLDVVLRVLNNIRAWAAARPEQSAVQLWALDLSLLLPHRPLRLRLERARLLVERGEFRAGARELEAYADVAGEVEPQSADAVRREAREARARLN
ncbi:transglutaminase-like domain-containing protein [Streptomyces sp. DSM 42041]|uniref:Transglutaminase-like domain-containing protein n=1 Tax=Streptomyces hazeniae TaxID=3075538 RepID=A0ABU2NMK8_9ACTN|nr:transglutaminase-like domain-containing protein [Streptomyces sp. DSM 42041]MDT0377980.1 transglutaminase-like domain-containing protein [Streptomyces sp. DSM 42041]